MQNLKENDHGRKKMETEMETSVTRGSYGGMLGSLSKPESRMPRKTFRILRGDFQRIICEYIMS